MYRKSILILMVIFGTLSLRAQTSWGIKSGVNLSKYTAFDDEQSTYTGFHVTGFVDIPLSTHFSIQPALSFQKKGTKYEDYFSEGRVQTVFTRSVNSVELPLNVMVNIPFGNDKIFFGMGPYIGYNLSGKEWTRNVTGYGKGSWDLEINGKYSSSDRNMNKLEGGANFLGGYQMKNGFLINVQYGCGMSQLIPEDDSTVSNRVWSFSVGYKF
ncbi:porin family protein [Sphingobacterium sp. LRF_L2]|uniref:porin family protein n=1 Tax=Sphingobacterium sp. LRF_L2 TaxID=3369421 RepID=UPI003F5DF30A